MYNVYCASYIVLNTAYTLNMKLHFRTFTLRITLGTFINNTGQKTSNMPGTFKYRSGNRPQSEDIQAQIEQRITPNKKRSKSDSRNVTYRLYIMN